MAVRKVRPSLFHLWGMQHADAVEMIATMRIAPDPQVWADLGCGTGTFTRALAQLLPAGSVVHAVDRDASVMRSLASEGDVTIRTQVGDIGDNAFQLADLDGVLMANALHFIRDQRAFLQRARTWMKPNAAFLFVEYDTAVANPPWVPYPVPFSTLERLFAGSTVRRLGSRASAYGRAELYAAQVLP